jgi:hypothetical protein
MLKKETLRKADIVTGVVILAFGIWVLIQALKMPMVGNYAGVENAWYISPALFPMIVGIFLILLSVILIVNAARELDGDGLAGIVKSVRGYFAQQRFREEGQIRFASILIILFSFVYLLIPYVDFFLASVFFLFTFISLFYLDDFAALKRLTLIYALIQIANILLFASGLAALINGLFTYSSDVVILVEIIAFVMLVGRGAGESGRKRFRLALLLSIIVPLILLPTFKFFLLVPLPNEGGIVDLMSLIRYRVF